MNEQINERIYDLVEMYDFTDLSENDKEFVLRNMPKAEYDAMRSTIADTRKLLSKYPYNEKSGKHPGLRKIVFYPVELYKIAAMIVLAIVSGFLFSKLKDSAQPSLLAKADTVVVKKTDTVYVRVKDTVVQIKEKKVYRNNIAPVQVFSGSSEFSGNTGADWDCTKELCPNDVRNLSAVKGNNSFSNDSALSDFIVTTN